jgi:hypothetical protein
LRAIVPVTVLLLLIMLRKFPVAGDAGKVNVVPAVITYVLPGSPVIGVVTTSTA